ncbi:MAG: riboflavin synthase [candidate division Zixibacteria bacterium]
MFTGIIQEIGRVRSAVRKNNLVLDIESGIIAPKLKKGDSIAINGACQTVIELPGGGFRVEAIEETLSRTTLGKLISGDYVNLEAPLATGEMFHGHFVQGHIDCVGKIVSIIPRKGSDIYKIAYPGQYDKYLIEKGSICIEGISLTVTMTENGNLTIAVIPHTVENTVLRYRKTGDNVNLEFDLFAKYVEKMIQSDKSKLTFNFLKEHGLG